MAVLCPVAGKPGKRVPVITVRNLVREERLPEVEGREWFFCDLPDCEVVYFAEDGSSLSKDALKVRVGSKEKAAPHPVCYCFGHTAESIEEEIASTGRSTVAAAIAAKVKAGKCSCELLNPKGSCCLGDVNRVVKAAFASLGAGDLKASHAEEATHDCCTDPPKNAEGRTSASRATRAGVFATSAAVLSAIAASACCWLPLLLVAVGASAAGVSAAFEKVRPVFLLIAPLLLGAGFYFAYFRKEACGPGGACTAPNPRLTRFNRAMLWIATGLVLVIAFFPSYVGLFFGRGTPLTSDTGAIPTDAVVFRIEGMTCEGCAVSIEKELARVPGVRSAAVIYSENRAVVVVDPAAPPEITALVDAVRRAGYEAETATER